MIGVVGRITESKGHHLLLQAVARLPLEVRNKIRILFVGSEAPGCDSDIQYARKLRAEASRHGLEKQIFMGRISIGPWPLLRIDGRAGASGAGRSHGHRDS